jgi:alpha-D-xyloside xylohydrolase
MNVLWKIAALGILFAITAVSVCVSGAAAAADYTRRPDGIVLNMKTGKLKIEVRAENIIHVLYSRTDSFPDRKSLVVLDSIGTAPEWSLKENGNVLTIVTKYISADVDRGTGAVTYRDDAGNVILREPDGGRTMTAANVSDENTWHAQQNFVLSADEAIYGLGQFQDGVMNWRGHDVLIAQANTISVVPFLLSTAGYGILWDNCSMSKFHDGADGAWLWSEVADAVDYYFVYGPDPDRVIAGYRKLTGPAPMFAKWAFGYFQSKEKYNTAAELLSVVKEYRDRGLPLDTIVQDWWYWGKYSWNAMKFDEANYPDPAATIDELHNKYHAHIMISIWPKFGEITDAYKDMASRGYLYKMPGAAEQGTYDAFNDGARQLYWKYANDGIFSKGMDAWWMDATEPEIASAKTQESTMASIRAAKRCALGTTARYLNAYSLMTTKGVYENQRKATDAKRVFILTRSGFAGQQRNAAATWSGDIEAEWGVLHNQISGGLNFGMAGIPYWTTDIGAFFVRYAGGGRNDEYKEMYVRWFQFGAFCPIFRSHGTHTPREIWRFGEPGTWAYDSLAKYDNLRYRLLPYIYSLAWRVTNDGYTIMRGLAFDFRNDPNVRGIDDQFMFGPAFLVNPVTRPMYHKEKLNPIAKMIKDTKSEVEVEMMTDWKTKNRKVYLPAAAGWYDFWTGKRTGGGQTVDAPSPIDIMPLFVRAGSIVPMGPKLQYATEKPADPIELRVYPGADAEFTIYEDENDNYNYEKGIYATIPIKWNDAAGTLTIGDRQGKFPGMPESRTFEIVIVGENHGVGVEPSDKPDRTAAYSGKSLTVKCR